MTVSRNTSGNCPVRNNSPRELIDIIAQGIRRVIERLRVTERCRRITTFVVSPGDRLGDAEPVEAVARTSRVNVGRSQRRAISGVRRRGHARRTTAARHCRLQAIVDRLSLANACADRRPAQRRGPRTKRRRRARLVAVDDRHRLLSVHHRARSHGRQQPGMANGALFMTLEDETAQVNMILWPGLLEEFREEALAQRCAARRIPRVARRREGAARGALKKRIFTYAKRSVPITSDTGTDYIDPEPHSQEQRLGGDRCTGRSQPNRGQVKAFADHIRLN
ncbi:hypothetical protein BDI4_40075 [Burkholderia diffusa]|nr:hypothetical protein BDI4_40075 [Burkholderia diffusa]